MRIMSYFLTALFLFVLGDKSFAVSPMPEEVKPEAKGTICTIQIAAVADSSKGIDREVTTATLTFGSNMSKHEVWEKIHAYTKDRLNDGTTSNIRIECIFLHEQ
jgi:hypothetical protein